MPYDGLLVGLGNPGIQYARTRHNFGFLLVDHLLAFWTRQSGISCTRQKGRLNALLWEVQTDTGRWLLAAPQTFMNLSGHVVSALSKRHGIRPEHILVAHDELDLPLGVVRFKFSGGLAGHNGLKSIAADLGTRDFARLRLGIGRPPGYADMAAYVLRSFAPQEWEVVAQSLDLARQAVLDYCQSGLENATTRLHSR